MRLRLVVWACALLSALALRRPHRRMIQAGALAVLGVVSPIAAANEPGQGAFASLYDDAASFADAIARERTRLDRALTVTGITVPHHLVAADLIARGFWAAQGNVYDRVIVLSPDHFRRSRRPLATTGRDFETVFGRLATDRAATDALLRDETLFESSDLFEKEHGIQAVLAFVKWFFPDVRIVPVVVSLSATRADWERAATALMEFAGARTLVVQSTDYSHYLLPEVSARRDQETLNVVAADDIAAVERLVSPDHLDSKGSQYIQMALQMRRGSHATVIANRNLVEYVPSSTRTTSYVVAVYAREVAAYPHAFTDQDVLFFGGDTLLGRWLTRALADPAVAKDLVATVRTFTGGAPLVLNLEGVLLDELPEGLDPNLHAMDARLAVPILTALNTRAASLANNHAFDLGRDGYRETVAALERAGITPLIHGKVADLGALRVIPLNFIGANDRIGYPAVRGNDLDKLCRVAAQPPLIAFAHWGVEYTDALSDKEYAAAAEMHRCGIEAIVGAHSHRAATRIEAMQGGEYAIVPTLGNFLFDQNARRGSGTLLELRRFRQGTYAMRLIPLPNLFDRANELLRKRAVATSPGD